MANPFSSAAKSSGAAKMRAMGGRASKATGGAAIAAKACGGGTSSSGGSDMKAPGYKSGGRLDKIRRDKGGVHKRTKLNVQAPEDVVPPPPAAAAVPGAMAAPPMPPGIMKRGGKVHKARGGGITAGAETGVGRLQKAHMR